MSRLLGTLVLLTLLAPVAAADEIALDESTKPRLPELAPVGRAIANGASSAADATGDALGAFGAGLASLAKGIGGALGAAASAIGAAFAALGKALLAALQALGSALAALGSLLASIGVALGKLLGSGARYASAHPKETAIVAGSASGVSLLAWAAKKWWLSLFLPLYSRLAKSEMLDNHVRNSVYEFVKTNPGAHPSRIAQTLGLGWGTVVYHLARLEESSLVTPRSAHNRKCYFAVGGELDNAGRSAVAAMSTDKARFIVDALRASPGLSQKELAERLGMSQALLSWHVKRLIASGILVSTRAGRSNLLQVAEHVPTMGAPAALAA